GGERVDQFVQPRAFEHFVELVQRQADAVVGHPALREVVGADAFGAVAAADHRLARLGFGALGLLAPLFEQSRAQHLHRLGAVLVLAALVLHRDDDPRRDVSDANSGVGRVDVLTARARRAVDVDAQVVLVDRHVDFARLGQHRYGRRRGVDAPAAFGHRHALHAVDPAFELELGEDAVARDVGDDFLEAADVGGVHADRLDLPALLGGVALVHAVEVGGEQRRLVAAGAGADFEHRRAGVGRIARQHRDLQLVFGFGEALAQFGELFVGERFHFGVVGKGRELGDLGPHLAHFTRRASHGLELRIVAARGDERLTLELPRSEARFELGEAVGDLREALFGDGHSATPPTPNSSS